jgi:uncharacterized protein
MPRPEVAAAGSGSEGAAPLQVDVVYALPGEQHIVPLTVPHDCSVTRAVERSGLLQRFPSILERPLQYAIFNRVVEGSALLRQGDRVEILRPLQIDPKEARRREAARARAGKR